MKKINITLLFVCIASIGFAQNYGGAKKGSSLGFATNLTNFNSTTEPSKVDPGFSLIYWKGIEKHFDVSLRYNGAFSKFSKSKVSTTSFVSEFETSLHTRLLTNDHLLNAFTSFGLGLGNYGKDAWSGYVPVGVGAQVNLGNEGYIFLQTNYRMSLNGALLDNNMFYSIGFTQNL